MGGIIIVLQMLNIIIVVFGKYTKKSLVASLIISLAVAVLSWIESSNESGYIFIAIFYILSCIQYTKDLEKMK